MYIRFLNVSSFSTPLRCTQRDISKIIFHYKFFSFVQLSFFFLSSTSSLRFSLLHTNEIHVKSSGNHLKFLLTSHNPCWLSFSDNHILYTQAIENKKKFKSIFSDWDIYTSHCQNQWPITWHFWNWGFEWSRYMPPLELMHDFLVTKIWRPYLWGLKVLPK